MADFGSVQEVLQDTQERAACISRLAPKAPAYIVSLIESLNGRAEELATASGAYITPQLHVECLRLRADMCGIVATLSTDEWNTARQAHRAAEEALVRVPAAPKYPPHGKAAAAAAAAAAASTTSTAKAPAKAAATPAAEAPALRPQQPSGPPWKAKPQRPSGPPPKTGPLPAPPRHGGRQGPYSK